MSRNSWIFVIILVILAFSLWVLVPIDSSRFGRTGIQYGSTCPAVCALSFRRT